MSSGPSAHPTTEFCSVMIVEVHSCQSSCTHLQSRDGFKVSCLCWNMVGSPPGTFTVEFFDHGMQIE